MKPKVRGKREDTKKQNKTLNPERENRKRKYWKGNYILKTNNNIRKLIRTEGHEFSDCKGLRNE